MGRTGGRTAKTDDDDARVMFMFMTAGLFFLSSVRSADLVVLCMLMMFCLLRLTVEEGMDLDAESATLPQRSDWQLRVS